ncbi:MAG: RNA recognition motif domain-containing protein [Chitinophagales bacterium]
MNIFVAKLNFETREDDLRELFEEFGTVDSVKIIMDRATHKSKGFGFVEMPDDNQAYAAINDLNDNEFDGRVIVVKKAKPREDNSGGFRGRSNYNSGGRGNYNSGGRDNYNRNRY